MSVIIYSQSLKNDDPKDFAVDGDFTSSPASYIEFFTYLEKTNFKDTGTDKVQRWSFRVLSFNPIHIFKIYCEQKDSSGRNSPIFIGVDTKNLSNLTKHLEKFLKDCKEKGSGERTVSDAVKNKLSKKIKQLLKKTKIIIATMMILVISGALWHILATK